ncbi:copper chaperone PCu(A)C [Blastococcus tunisiensis]|uniref:Copper(I)-binding protein n=1 Tax=Blastococcus tunisiensis TaxID=1798228 RepID=A0A1I2KL57_9ACTN|nr:copper chaperone PCu(A)C [Blastococcus sp. DSM 46838]SFF65851.1 Copper(I)-binding protein [Blastococcus sp. DSM 46838]
MTRPHPVRTALTAAACAAVLPLAACSQDNPIENEGTEVIGGNAGADEAVTEDIKITALMLDYPGDGQWEEGEDVTLYAAITNTGTTADRLVDVTGEDFADAQLAALDGSDGAIEVPENDNVYLEPEGEPSVILQDLQTSLRSSQSIPVTFVFEEAGEVTMTATVSSSPPGEGDFEAPEDPTPEE